MAVSAGELDRRIRIERQDPGKDGYGGKTDDWGLVAETAAKLIYGPASERREAAQESAAVTATFRVRRNRVTRTFTAEHRLRFDPFGALNASSPIWDISSVVPFERDALDITATRKA